MIVAYTWGVVSVQRVIGRPSLLVAVLFSVVLSLSAGAAAISYTVQVVAVSDQEVALEVQGQLLRQGFPAYVVRASTGDRDVYRVRVGAFANRGAALSYAEAMPQVFGSRPVPALAETIPGGIMLLEPELLLDSAAVDGVVLLEWGDEVAVRIQLSADAPAGYHVFDGDATAEFEAWSAVPLEQGVLRVRNLALWPSTWDEDAAAVLEAFQRSMVSFVAGELALSADEVAGAIFSGEPPYLVVLERADPQQADPGELLALGLPGEMGVSGPVEYLGEASLLPTPVEVLYAFDGLLPDGPLQGEGWTALADEGFTRIDPNDGSAGWRAGVGVPLWSGGRYLLTTDGARLRLFRLLPR